MESEENGKQLQEISRRESIVSVDLQYAIAVSEHLKEAFEQLEQEGAELQPWAKKYIAQSLWTDYAKTPRDATGRIREEWTVWCGTQERPTAVPFKAGTSKEEIRSWFKETFGLIPA